MHWKDRTTLWEDGGLDEQVEGVGIEEDSGDK